MKIAAVNYSDKIGWFPRGQERLGRTLYEHGFSGDYLAFTQLLKGWPSHQQVPYGFKVHAIAEARQLGYDLVFYGDASIYLVGAWKPIYNVILRLGYYLETTEHTLGNWCSDAALTQMGIDRETAFNIPTIVAGCVGFDFRSAVACDVLDRWLALAQDGITFQGSWHNHGCSVSRDLRVQGHRHDQSALSGIAHHLKLQLLPFETHIFYTTPPPARATFHCHPAL